MQNQTILLVEDNPDDVALTLRAFKKVNVANKIDVVSDGEQALDYLFCRGEYSSRDPRDLPAVILLDIKLPKVDGLEVLKAVRENPVTKLVPVVILTSSKGDSDLANGYKLGANSYVRKPVDFEHFVEAARQVKLYWLILNEAPPTQET